MIKTMNIIFVTSELAPYSQTGGLGIVASSLAKTVHDNNCSIGVITPFYGKIIKKNSSFNLIHKNIPVKVDSEKTIKINVWKSYLKENLPVYFIENKKYFSQRSSPYGSNNDNLRFLIFNHAVLKVTSLLNKKIDVLHCHDWHSGIIPHLLKNDVRYKALASIKTLLTIHNLAFQRGHIKDNFKVKKYTRSKTLPLSSSEELKYVNFLRHGILNADLINTVSDKYREEILTPKFGYGLDVILNERKKNLYGIINGIDHDIYNPSNDNNLFRTYDNKDLARKNVNKIKLKSVLGLNNETKSPLFTMTSRITHQKGFSLFLEIVDALMTMGASVIVMGNGDKKYINALKKTVKKYPKQFALMPFNKKKENLLYAASDFFLLPSYYEPCGINQMIAMRYGSVPIVRAVGGLYDTVTEFNSVNRTGTGFMFHDFDAFSFYGAIVKAHEVYKNKTFWRQLIKKIMKQSTGWKIPAKKYVALYKKLIKL